MFMVREGRQGGEVRCVVIAEDQNGVGTLVVIGVYAALNAMLNIDKLSEMQHRTISSVLIWAPAAQLEDSYTAN
jgi:hypothetical protein